MSRGHRAPQESLIPREPRLRHIRKILRLLRPRCDRYGRIVRWQDLYRSVGYYRNVLDLSQKIRTIVEGFVTPKIPKLKEAVPSLGDLPVRALRDALVHNSFESLGRRIEKQRRDILLVAAAHVVKTIETRVWKMVFLRAEPKELRRLGIDSHVRNLLVELLAVSRKADMLFIRFLAYAYLTPRAHDGATQTGLALPGHKKLYTLASLFPQETGSIAAALKKIMQEHEGWIDQPGGILMRTYLQVLGRFYEERDPDLAAIYQDESVRLYSRILASGFPVIFGSTSSSYCKEPYLDPELKVSVVAYGHQYQREQFARAREALVTMLRNEGMHKFGKELKRQAIQSVVVVCGYGANLTFSAVAESGSGNDITWYVNEHKCQHEDRFCEALRLIGTDGAVFDPSALRKSSQWIIRMSRMVAFMHECMHSVYPFGAPEMGRFGRRPQTIIDEVKAENIGRPRLLQLVEGGIIRGTKAQWICVMLASFLQMLDQQTLGDPYHCAASYSLNALFERGAVVMKKGKVWIRDFDLFVCVQKEAADRMLSFLRDERMNEKRALSWIRRCCYPSQEVLRLEDFLKRRRHRLAP